MENLQSLHNFPLTIHLKYRKETVLPWWIQLFWTTFVNIPKESMHNGCMCKFNKCMHLHKCCTMLEYLLQINVLLLLINWVHKSICKKTAYHRARAFIIFFCSLIPCPSVLDSLFSVSIYFGNNISLSTVFSLGTWQRRRLEKLLPCLPLLLT